MQEWEWYVLNPNGTVDLDVSNDAEVADVVHLPRATIGHIRKFGLMLEDADEVVRVFEEQVRADCGMTKEALILLERLMTIDVCERRLGNESCRCDTERRFACSIGACWSVG